MTQRAPSEHGDRSNDGPAGELGFWTIPNIISVARLAAIPAFLWLLLVEDEVAAAAVLLMIIGATDWIDGYLARRLGQVSAIGKVLDPLADRLAIAAAVIGGWIANVLPDWFAGLLVLREVVGAMISAVLWMRLKQALVVRYLGKVATTLIYASVPAFYLAAADIGRDVLYPAASVAGAVGVVLYYWVGVLYVNDARQMLRAQEAPR